MDVVDDAEGPLDPRIQIELENLNTATDNINKLEIELDEAHTAFGQLLSESTRRLKVISNKLGANCIDRARCYYEASDVARQARIRCQHQAKLFQRASEIHAAAKETVALAETRFVSHRHEWNFDQAWQDMLNHATMKVTDAENQKAECGREHLRRATLFHDAEMKVQQLEEKYRRSILKAQPYFETRAQYDEMLATQKECVERLQKAVKDAKRSYSSSFRALEDISNRIHRQRQDYDMLANGPREPGVGAELVNGGDSLNYKAELNKISVSRVDSLASSGEPDSEDRSKDFDDIRDLKERVDRLGGRSIDGSESVSSQWELELQASMEKLNNLSMKALDCKSNERADERDDEKNSRNIGNENALRAHESPRPADREPTKSLKNNENEKKKLPIDFQILRKSSSNASIATIATSNNKIRSPSPRNNPVDSIIAGSEIAPRNGISKSLSNSPVINVNFGFGTTRTANEQRDKNKIQKNDNVETAKSRNRNDSSESTSEIDFRAGENLTSSRYDEEDDRRESRASDLSTMPKSIGSEPRTDTKNRVEKLAKYSSLSVDSTPVRISKTPLARISIKSFDRGDESSKKTASVRELPLLSLFESTRESSMTRDRCCSMIDLAEKDYLKTRLDNPDLQNIQTVGAERLASARHNIMGRRFEASTNFKK